jgi:hypothetical protein
MSTASTAVFQYPSLLRRRHGPDGYTDYRKFKPWLRDEFVFRCVYCLIRERRLPWGADDLGVDHWKAKSRHPEAICQYENLLYACNHCNTAKADAWVPLHPVETWLGAHVEVREDGWVDGLTEEGKQFARILRMNRASLVAFRRDLLARLRILSASDDPEAQAAVHQCLSFPEDLPDLRLSPPPRNTRPGGVGHCYYVLRERGDLPEMY